MFTMGFAERFQQGEDDGSSEIDREAAQRSAEFIADLMDTAIRVPGTDIRIGLDPLIGLLPGVGDAIAGAIGSTLLLLAHRLGVPRIVQVRMGLNVLLNALGGAVPGFGDLFSVWFKSNVRNARLLRRYASAPRHSTTSDWAFVLGLIVVVLVGMVLALAGVLWLVSRLWEAVG
jgi:hypothetical protein